MREARMQHHNNGASRDRRVPPSRQTHPVRNLVAAALSLGLLLAAIPSTAFGYADPGTGAFLYQAAVGAIVGGAFYFRKILGFFTRKEEVKPDQQSDTGAQS